MARYWKGVVLKRLDVEPSQHVLLEILKEDKAGRNNDIVDFIRLLDITSGPYTYMVDSAWGAGKTFFIKSVELVLKAFNPKISNIDTLPEELSSLKTQLNDVKTCFVPFYFNAWQNDFAPDPLSALLATMAITFDREKVLKVKGMKDAAIAVVDAALSVTSISGVGNVVDAMSGTSFVASYEKMRSIREKLNEFVDTIAFEGNAKLIIFIDELDRCRPDFSVRLLEQTKSMFDNQQVVLVFSTDSQQLASAVGGMYGCGFDSVRFLERFFDQKVMLTPVDGFSFVMGREIHAGVETYERLVHEYANYNPLTFRDAYRIQLKIEGGKRECAKHANQGTLSFFAYQVLLPLLIFIERDNQRLYRNIITGADYEALFEYGCKFDTFNSMVEKCLPRSNAVEHETKTEVEKRKKGYILDLCLVVFENDESGCEYYDAMERLGSSNYVRFPDKIFKRLDFSS